MCIRDRGWKELAKIGSEQFTTPSPLKDSQVGTVSVADALKRVKTAAGTAVRDNFSNLTDTYGIDAVKKRVLTALAAQAASIVPGVNVTGTQILSRERGTILNPNMTLLMNAPSLRSFSFQFKMTPRDDREAKQVKSIIRSFKKNMAPFTETSKTFLKTPNVFELRYKKGNDDHPFLHQFKQCALTDISTNYTGEGVYATYGDGSPISTIMTLQFTELVPIYQSDYGDDSDFDADSDGVGYWYGILQRTTNFTISFTSFW